MLSSSLVLADLSGTEYFWLIPPDEKQYLESILTSAFASHWQPSRLQMGEAEP